MNRIWIQRAAIVAIWVAVVLTWRNWQTSNDLGTIEAAQRLIDEVDAMWWGPLAYTAAYLARPLLLFPASIMTVAAGLLFGPVAGVLIVIVAANASAMLAYLIGRTLTKEPDADGAGLIARWGDRMRERSFETVFLMRLLFLPYDLVNYVSGALRIRWTSFLLATLLGTLPGTISFVLLGASLERIDEGLEGINPWAIVASVVIFVASIVVARVVRTPGETTDTTAQSDPETAADTEVPAPTSVHGSEI